MKSFILLIATMGLLSSTGSAHEGHDTPGALPPPPNGGKLAEAAHEGGHAHGAKEEAEIFVEAKLDGKKLKVFAHALEGSTFKTLSPSASLSLSEVKIEQPRSKKTTVVPVKASGNYWEADIGQVSDRRILVYASLMDGKEKKTAKIQIEK